MWKRMHTVELSGFGSKGILSQAGTWSPWPTSLLGKEFMQNVQEIFELQLNIHIHLFVAYAIHR